MDPEFEQHLTAEGIEYHGAEIPEQLWPLIENSDKEPGDPEFIDLDEEEVILYRGDRGENLRDLRKDDGALSREFPIYFTESREDAVERYAGGFNQEEYIIQVSVPFEAIDYLGEQKANELERNEGPELEPGNMYYLKSYMGSIELAASYVPEEWIDSIESLDQN